MTNRLAFSFMCLRTSRLNLALENLNMSVIFLSPYSFFDFFSKPQYLCGFLAVFIVNHFMFFPVCNPVSDWLARIAARFYSCSFTLHEQNAAIRTSCNRYILVAKTILAHSIVCGIYFNCDSTIFTIYKFIAAKLIPLITKFAQIANMYFSFCFIVNYQSITIIAV